MDINQMMELARKASELNKKGDAQRAYLTVLEYYSDCLGESFNIGSDNIIDASNVLEASYYLYASGHSVELSYTFFVKLYNAGFFRKELYQIMYDNFLMKVIEKQKKLYEKNCKILSIYPYYFESENLSFEQLNIRFFPFGKSGYLPYNRKMDSFHSYRNINEPIIEHNFFADLNNPVKADNLFSQYEIEYLNDMVRDSILCARENHIYLCYDSFDEFCDYLQIIDLSKILKDKKIVFLFGNDKNRYPIDFKSEYGIDYSTNNVKFFSVSEIHKIVWHTQLSSHNGGDFFNEVLHGHPNMLCLPSIFYYKMMERVGELKTIIHDLRTLKQKGAYLDKLKSICTDNNFDENVIKSFIKMSNPTEKDYFVCLYLANKSINNYLDKESRIAPCILFQPHFENINFSITVDANNRGVLNSDEYNQIVKSSLLNGFKYVKTFTPFRRITTSYAAMIRFNLNSVKESIEKNKDRLVYIQNGIASRVLNRSYMYDWQERLFVDSRLVRFEDGKLNPKATFCALAYFLDIPYTETMTFCSDNTGLNPESYKGNVRGFDPSSVYVTYDEYANKYERMYIEFLSMDVYKEYGYGFNYINGGDVVDIDKEYVMNLTNHFDCFDNHFRSALSMYSYEAISRLFEGMSENNWIEYRNTFEEKILGYYKELCREIVKSLMSGNKTLVNESGQPLRFMKMLELDPELLEQPLYH